MLLVMFEDNKSAGLGVGEGGGEWKIKVCFGCRCSLAISTRTNNEARDQSFSLNLSDMYMI